MPCSSIVSQRFTSATNKTLAMMTGSDFSYIIITKTVMMMINIITIRMMMTIIVKGLLRHDKQILAMVTRSHD